MDILRILFSTLASAASLYSFVCVIRILLSWFPGAQGSALGTILSTICDPYLNWFRRFRFRAFPIDFSPILALGALSVVTTVFSTIGMTGKISLGIVLVLLLQVVWSFVNFVIILLGILVGARLVANLINKDTFSQFWRSADTFLNPLVSRITSFPLFRVKGGMTYRNELIVTFLVLLCGWFLLRTGVSVLISLLISLPF